MNKKQSYFLAGLIFGLYNEIFFANEWVYSEILGPTFFGAPIISFPGWGLLAMIAMILSDKSIKAGLNKIASDLMWFAIIFIPLEWLGSTVGLWIYRFELHENRFAMAIGYLFVGIIISSMGRRFAGDKR